jgi:hypothetical protein
MVEPIRIPGPKLPPTQLSPSLHRLSKPAASSGVSFPVRRLLSAVTVATLSGGLLAVPVLTLPVVHPHAVATSVAEVPVRAVTDAPGVLGRASREHAGHFDLVGATWSAGSFDPRSTRIETRVHKGSGWTSWEALEPTDTGADAGSADALRAARLHGDVQTAEPVWVGHADGVEARVVAAPNRPANASPAALPDDLEVVLVDGGTSNADNAAQRVMFHGSTASAAADRPEILTRADWGADESLRRNACPEGPDYSSSIRMGFVHHTDGTNGYSRSEVPSILRGIYAYHVKANGWCDVGYNFLVDRFGRIWEGRYGGISKNVLGAHTGGFNTNSFGTSLIGDFTGTAPSSAMLSAVERLFAWKLSRNYRDPLGTSTLVAGSFSGSRYAEGNTVTFDTVSGHRDADYTTCPGSAAYRTLGSIRTGIRDVMAAGFVAPSQSAPAIRMAGGVLKVRAAVIAKQTWTLTVTDVDGAVVRTTSGTASRSTKAVAAWDLRGDDGLPVLPGEYRLQLTGGTAAGATAVPWSSTVTVTPPVALSVPAQRSLGGSVTPKGAGIPGHSVSVSVTGPEGTTQLGSFLVSSTGRWSASAPVAVDGDLTWTVTDPAVSGYSGQRRTRVAPAVTNPVEQVSFVPAGTALTVRGTALPGAGSPVHLMTQQAGAAGATAGAGLPVATDGTWSSSLTPAKPTAFWAADARGLVSAKRLVYPVAVPTATAPDEGYAGRSVRVTGNAGNAPVEVTFSARQPDGVWTTVARRTAGTDGRFSFRLPLADAPGGVARWRVTTAYGQAGGPVTIAAVFPPTVAGPARSVWNGIHVLTGRAVPGDEVTIETAKPGGTWATAGTVKAAADETWSFPLTFTRDLRWRVRSASGTSDAGLTRIVPTLRAPATSVSRAKVTLHGRAIPGRLVHVQRRPPGTTEWVELTAVRAARDGSWEVVRRPQRSAEWRVVSHRQASRIVTITIG